MVEPTRLIENLDGGNRTQFRLDLEKLINIHSLENYSGTPDWAIAQYLCESLTAFESGVRLREKYYGRFGTA